MVTGSTIIVIALAMMVTSDAVGSIPSSLIAVIFHLLGYNGTIGPVRWACYMELMDPFGIGVASALIFIFACVIAFVFPFMVLKLELSGAFAIFLGLSVFCWLYLFFEMKETKGKTIIEICQMFYHDYND